MAERTRHRQTAEQTHAQAQVKEVPMAEKDKRTYVKVHDGLPDHPKVIEAGGEAGWLYICGLAYASRQLTDGVIPKRLVPRLTDSSKSEASASALVRVGLWHDGENDCGSCPSAGPDAYVIHDYLEHQRSASEVADLRAKRSVAGQRGGKRSGESRREASAAEAKAEASASALVKQTRSKSEAETETETEVKEKTSEAASRPPADLPRPDIDAVCEHLADRLEKTGSKRPKITAKWRNDTRLLLDRDRITVDQARTAIDWALASDFWQAHILSPFKLRQKYEQLRRQAVAERNRAAPAGPTTAPETLTAEEMSNALRF